VPQQLCWHPLWDLGEECAENWGGQLHHQRNPTPAVDGGGEDAKRREGGIYSLYLSNQKLVLKKGSEFYEQKHLQDWRVICGHHQCLHLHHHVVVAVQYLMVMPPEIWWFNIRKKLEMVRTVRAASYSM